MSILVSGFSSSPRKFSDIEDGAIDAHSFFLSEGNWREHLGELCVTPDPGELDVDATEIREAATSYIDKMTAMASLKAVAEWHLGIARRVLTLSVTTLANGGNKVGVAG